LIINELAMSLRVSESVVVEVVTPNETASDVPPPGTGFETVTRTIRGVAMSEDSIAAVNFVELMNVVARALPLHFTTEP
jgi:hypothetical protein